jgi:hypothetical protein
MAPSPGVRVKEVSPNVCSVSKGSVVVTGSYKLVGSGLFWYMEGGISHGGHTAGYHYAHARPIHSKANVRIPPRV